MIDTDVVIVGAGPIGLITALGLARAGVDVTVLEEKPVGASGQHDMVYHWTTLPGLDRLGVLDDMRTAGLTGRLWTIQVPATSERLTIDLGGLAGAVPHPYTVHLPSDRLTRVVLPHLQRHRHAHAHWGTRVTGVSPDRDGVTVAAEGPDGPHEIRAHWVVGTDGAHSIVRRSLGLGFTGTTWPCRFVATTSEFDWAGIGFTDVTHRVDPVHPAMSGRIDRDLWRFIYAEPRTLSPETIPDRMAGVFRTVLGGDTDPQLRGWSAYRVHERAADTFRVGRVLLAGDAAHVTNPATSLGLAGGLLDSYVLSNALSAVVLGGRDEEVLDDYATRRHRAFWEITSPLSARSMHLLLADDPRHLETELNPYRRAADNPRTLIETYREFGDLETPSQA